MAFIRKKWLDLVVLFILVIGIIFRLTSYGDLRLSVGNPDTPSYIRSSIAPLFSWSSFAGERLLTTNALYKLANDESRCKLTAFSMPGIGEEAKRALQPCFGWIALLQNILAVIAWTCLAWTTARWLVNPLPRLVLTILILAFAFTPQIAEWESVLGPESLTLTLFLISFALLEEIAYGIIIKKVDFRSATIRLLAITWLIVFLAWIFIRDAHLYTIPIFVVMVVPLVAGWGLRRQKTIYLIVLTLVAFFFIGYRSAKDSLRATHFPVTNSFYFYITPYPERLAFFEQRGLPEPQSPEYEAWLDKNLAGTYALFLLTHPRFVIDTVIEFRTYFGSDYLQPYFKPDDTPLYRYSLLSGELVHPQTNSIYLIDFFLFAGLCFAAYRKRDEVLVSWSWLAGWLFFSALVMLFITFFGDVAGTRRHIFPSVEMLRLMFWILTALMIDRMIGNKNNAFSRPGQTLSEVGALA